jgi:ParB family chromosome partitioning protein
MTSGTFHAVQVSLIKVSRDQRQRSELSGIDVLADSIRRLGLINPITISRDGELIAGERRLSAVKLLGWEMVPIQYTDEIDESSKRAIELEENVKRVDLTWQEQCKAVTEYHEIRLSQEKSWSQEKTALALGLEQPTVSQYLGITEEVRRGNADLLQQPLLSTARNMVARTNERRNDKALEALRGFTLTDVEPAPSIITADFTKWVTTYKGPRFNFLHCDFPYGINADKMQQGGSVATHGGYDDSSETYWHLLNALCNSIDRICTESAHLMFWFSMHYYADTLDFFSNHSDFVIDPFPLVWMKSDNIGLLPDPQRGPRRIYETCFFGSRGDRKIVSSVSNAFAAPTDRQQHMSTKPEAVLRHFFRMFVDENSVMLDPTCGSGSALRAAKSLGAGHILGVEINGEFADRATIALRRVNAP